MKLLKEMTSLSFETIIVGVYAYGFDQNWLGRQVDSATISELAKLNEKYQISPVDRFFVQKPKT